MAIRIAINGFGRIGRAAFKIALEKPDLEVVAINDLTDNKTLAHLLKYDTVYGRYGRKIAFDEKHLIVDGDSIPATAEKDPTKLPWRELKVEVVLECTGHFTTREKAKGHLEAGAKRVIISAPAKSEDVDTILLGVNEDRLENQDIISNASCTTNCITPVAAVIEEQFGIEKALMTTIHAVTSTQNVVDGPNKDLRRARAACHNIIPTSTGAARAAAKTLSSLEGKFDAFAIRVPVPVVSIADFTILTKQKTSVEDVNAAFRRAKDHPLYQGIIAVTEEPVVSSDFIGDPHSAIIDLNLTKVVDGNLVKVVAWYDNEWGYANRLAEMAIATGKAISR